jgi:uncharacterized integral membrane protein (TIGR00698 family)
MHKLRPSMEVLNNADGAATRCLATLRLGLPGIMASGTLAIAATFLSEHYGGPVMVFALLLGMAFHFLSQEGPCVAGVELASKRILRIAVGLLGAQITLSQIVSLGAMSVIAIVGSVGLTIGVGVGAARLLGLSERFGVLTGGAVSICGASAALAIASVMPKDDATECETVFTVIGVTTLSTVAMIAYPFAISLFHLDHLKSGIFLGGTIHDVAQVVGAGYSVSEETGNVATITKLLRVALLMPVVFVLPLFFRGRMQGTAPSGLPVPGFLFGFAGLVALNSVGMISAEVLVVLKEFSRWCLVTAIAALGMKTSLKSLAEVGARSIFLIVAETLFLAGLVLAMVTWAR